MSERKAGWYWVRLPGEWVSAEWVAEPYSMWMIRGVDYKTSEVGDVGPCIPTPNEPWQCVPVEPTEIMQDEGLIDMPTPDAHPYDCGMVYKAMLAAAPKPENS